MSERKDVAKWNALHGIGATFMQFGTDGIMANSRTSSTKRTAGRTRSKTADGPATTVTGSDIPAHNSSLSDEEQLELLRLRTIRKRGQMLTMGECDWLLELYWRAKNDE